MRQETVMDERPDNTERLLEEISIQLRHIKWVMVAGLTILVVLLLAVIGLVFFPVLAGLFIVAFLVVGPAAYLYHLFIATVQYRETRLRDREPTEENTLLTRTAR